MKAADINIFVETTPCSNDDNALYEIPGFQLFRNHFVENGTRTYIPLYKALWGLGNAPTLHCIMGTCVKFSTNCVMGT